MSASIGEHYQAVLADLRHKRGRLASELAEVESTISVIEKLWSTAGTVPSGARTSPQADPVVAPWNQFGTVSQAPSDDFDYSKVSVRWAVLGLLATVATGPMTTGAVTRALQARGVHKEGVSRFGNIVSAVLSNLRVKGEVEVIGNTGYQLTPAGRTMWAHIRATHKFQVTQQTPAQDSFVDLQ